MRKVSTLLLCSLAVAACSKLTEPPRPEPVETTAAPSDDLQAKKDAIKKNVVDPALGISASAAAQPPPTPPTNEKLESKDVQVGKGAEAKTGDT
ncbi:MAG TPA: hypothetical protein VIF62_13715, partial [Labilithrix sp.]